MGYDEDLMSVQRNDPKVQDLGFHGEDEIDGVELAIALEDNTYVQTVYLADCDLSDDTAIAFADTLHVNETILHLSLALNDISDKGAIALANALKVNTTLETLSLSLNQISYRGAAALLEALDYNLAITSLDIEGNSLFSAYKNDAVDRSMINKINKKCKANQFVKDRLRVVEENKAKLAGEGKLFHISGCFMPVSSDIVKHEHQMLLADLRCGAGR